MWLPFADFIAFATERLFPRLVVLEIRWIFGFSRKGLILSKVSSIEQSLMMMSSEISLPRRGSTLLIVALIDLDSL